VIEFTDPSDGEENVDIYDFRKKQKDIWDEFNFEVVFNIGQGIRVSGVGLENTNYQIFLLQEILKIQVLRFVVISI